MRAAPIVMVFALFLACATTSGPALTDEQMAELGVDEALLARGRALAVTECAECHRFYWPREYSSAEWPNIIKKMGDRASLRRSDIEALELYFVALSGAVRND